MKKAPTKIEQRLQLANDVICQLEAGKFYAGRGEFFSGFGQPNANVNLKADAQPILDGTPCTVCAKGALFVAHILRYDKISVRMVLRASPSNCGSFLSYFTEKMLDEIELLFEGRSFSWHYQNVPLSRIKKLIRYARKDLARFKNPKNRLIKIMRMLIKNKGKKLL